MNDAGAADHAWTAAWRDYRRRRNLLFAAWIGGWFGIMLTIWLGVPFITWIAAAAWMTTSLVTGIRLYGFPCPRCAKTFLSRHWVLNSGPQRQACVWCGLRKWAVPHLE